MAYDPSSIYPKPDPSIRKPVKEVKPIDKPVNLESRESHPKRKSSWLIWLIVLIVVAIGIYYIIAF